MVYEFLPVSICNMCLSDSGHHKILGKRLNGHQGKSPKRKTGIATTVVQCTNCGLIFSNPLPVPSNWQEHYSIPPEEYWRKEYFDINDAFIHEEKSKIEFVLPLSQGLKILDIGAGLGMSMKVYSKLGLDAYGVEPSKIFFDYAIQKMNIPAERLQNKLLEEANFTDHFFDFISFSAVLEHVTDPNLSLQRALRWLRPGGFIHISVPSSRWFISRMLNNYYRLIGTDYVTNLSPMHPPFHLYEFDLRSFEKNGVLNNYTVHQYENSVCETFMPKIFDGILKRYMRYTHTGMEIKVWLQSR